MPDFKHYLVAVSIFKNEAMFLDEWLTFHSAVGIEHFYLYNNFSTDDYADILSPWISAGKVTLVDWSFVAGQIGAYSHYIDNYKYFDRWAIFLDIDEFLFSPISPDIRKVLYNYEDLSGVFVYWALFGSSGHVNRPTGYVIDNYIKRLDVATANKEQHPAGVTGRAKQGKTIINPRMVKEVKVHYPAVWQGQMLDSKRRLPPNASASAEITLDVIRINHYWSKSLEDLAFKVARGDANKNRTLILTKYINREKSLNVENDYCIQYLWKYILRLKMF